MNKKKMLAFLDTAIIISFAIQIASVSISIAVSSISFGTWLGLLIIQVLYEKKLSLDKNLFKDIKAINIFIILYIFFEIFSRFFAVYPEGAFHNLKRLLLFSIFYTSLIKISDLKILFRIIFLNICAVSFVSVIELFQYALNFSETIGQMPFSEIRINYFNYPLTGGEIKMLSLLSVFPLIFAKQIFLVPKKYFIILLAPVFLSMILTQSRNVFLAVFISFTIFGIVVNRKFLLGFIAVIILGGIFLPSSALDRFKSIADLNHPSNEDRINMWSTGIKMFKDHPFTGIADSHIREIYSTYKKIERPGEGVHLHSNFIMILATTGIFGFISYIGMFLLIFLKQIKFYRQSENNIFKMLIMGSILVMVSFQISGIFEWSFGDHEVMTVFFFLISVPFVLYKFNENEAKL